MKYIDKLFQELPKAKGGYIIIIEVSKSILITMSKRKIRAGPGFYAYIGSAGGPGGLRARLLRHIRKTKKLRWHIDQITSNIYTNIIKIILSTEVWGKTFENRISLCLSNKNLDYIKGFGSSDDRNSRSHLFYSNSLKELESSIKECISDITSKYEEFNFNIV